LDSLQTKYLPSDERSGKALCLSGGGYRAALFHLGAVRRLSELGLLGELTAISGVSGGSIFAAHLAKHIGELHEGRFAHYEGTIAAPFRDFVKHDVRTTPALTRLLPWEWFNAGAGAEALQEQYEELLVPGMKLRDLPDKPTFYFCATDLAFGVNWIFSRGHVGDYQAGYLADATAGELPLAMAVAASSCFPPVFKPLPPGFAPAQFTKTGLCPLGPERDALIRQVALSDGGVYDNLGVEPVWKHCQMLLVSDGGKPFRFTKESGTPQQLLRIHDVIANQAEAVRKRWLIASYLKKDYGGAYFGIQNSVDEYPLPSVAGYSKSFASAVIAAIRTDLDCFSDDEIGVLENHGYSLAEAAYRSHVGDTASTAFVVPAPALWASKTSDFPALEDRLTKRLADSSHVHLLGH
jgi:NTE family protein